MRVLQVGKYYPPDPGGVETATRQVAESLARFGVENAVLCFAGKGPYADAAAACPVHRERVLAAVASQPLSVAYVRRLSELAPSFDVLHVHAPNPLAALAVFLARPKGALVLHWHSDVIGKKVFAAAVRPLETWLCRRADLVIGPTAVHLDASDRARDFAGKGAVVPFCVDEAMVRPDRVDPAAVAAIRERFGRRPMVFALGRLVPYKGFDVLVDAARLLSGDAVVVIGGDGPQKASLAGRIAAAGLSDRVFLAGRLPNADLPDWFAACDIFCLPSVTRAEMFGIVQLEAMAFGKPVVSTAIPRSGVPLVNVDGETGLVVPPGDAPALAAALSELLADAARRSRLGQGGLTAVAGRFSPRAVARALATAYGRVRPEILDRLDSGTPGEL
jgi:rhamnosyl/mannosyltransferase